MDILKGLSPKQKSVGAYQPHNDHKRNVRVKMKFKKGHSKKKYNFGNQYRVRACQIGIQKGHSNNL